MNRKLIILIIIVMLLCIGIVAIFLLNNKDKENSDNIIDIQNINENEEMNSTIEENIETQENGESEGKMINEIKLTVNNQVLTIKLNDNSSSRAFVEKLKEKDIVINAHDYGNFEKVGDLGFDLPTNDTNITTEPGDLILYQGNQITLYYDTNTWNFTKLGKIEGISSNELKEILGNGNVTLTFSL